MAEHPRQQAVGGRRHVAVQAVHPEAFVAAVLRVGSVGPGQVVRRVATPARRGRGKIGPQLTVWLLAVHRVAVPARKPLAAVEARRPEQPLVLVGRQPRGPVGPKARGERLGRQPLDVRVGDDRARHRLQRLPRDVAIAVHHHRRDVSRDPLAVAAPAHVRGQPRVEALGLREGVVGIAIRHRRQQSHHRVFVARHVFGCPAVARLAGDPELGDLRLPGSRLGQARRRLGVVAEDAVVAPARQMPQVVVGVAVRAVRREERPAHVDPALRADVPRHGQAPALQLAAASIDPRHVLLVVVAADGELYVDVEQHLGLRVAGSDPDVRAPLAAPGHHRREAEGGQGLAREGGEHRVRRGPLGHRAVVARVPRPVLLRVTASTRVRAGRRRRVPVHLPALGRRRGEAHDREHEPRRRRPEQREVDPPRAAHAVTARTSSSWSYIVSVEGSPSARIGTGTPGVS